jgi:Clostripain family
MAKNRKRSRRTPQPKKNWTVLVYMAAAKDEQTEQAAVRDIRELEEIGTTKAMNVVVQLDRGWPGYPERYRIHQGSSEPLPMNGHSHHRPRPTPSSSNTGDPRPLRDFLQWAYDSCRADHYLLVLWGHAYGLGFGRDHGDQLTLRELSRALVPFRKTGKLDLLGANACAMSYAEAAYELRNSAQYLVASEISMPFAGWPYARILQEIVKDAAIEPADLGEKIIDHFTDSLKGQNVALTLLNLKKAGQLRTRVTDLAQTVSRSIGRERTSTQTIDAFLDTAHGDVRPLIDLSNLCKNLDSVPNTAVKNAAGRMLELLDEKAGFVVKHVEGPDLEDLRGVGIFAPAVTGEAVLQRLELSEQRYKELALMKARDNRWAKLVYQDLKKHLAPTNEAITSFVNGTGAIRADDRTGVVQLLVSVERSFVKLENVTRETETIVTAFVRSRALSDDLSRPQRLAIGESLGFPYLRLASAHPQPVYSVVPGDSAIGNVDASSRVLGRVVPAQQALAKLEDALGHVERTVKKVLTNGRLGLGDVDPDVKPGGGLGPGDPDVKPGGGLGADVDPDVKPGGGLGLLPVFVGADTGASVGAATRIAQMYEHAARSLLVLEEAVGALENLLAAAYSSSTLQASDQDQFHKRIEKHVNQSFKEVIELVANAKQVIRWVLSHPSYGLGPGTEPGLGVASRRQLALAGGFSGRFLRLL